MNDSASYIHDSHTKDEQYLGLNPEWQKIVDESEVIFSECVATMGLLDSEVDLLMRAHQNVTAARYYGAAALPRYIRRLHDAIHD